MTKLEIMQLVKECPDKPARGIDPLTGREVPEGEVFTGKQNSVQTVRKSCRMYGVFISMVFLRRLNYTAKRISQDCYDCFLRKGSVSTFSISNP